MKITINWLEQTTTSTGKLKADATVVDEKGVENDKVTIWEDFPGFSDLKPGSVVLGEVQIKQNGKYTNKTLYPERTNTLTKPSYSGNKPGMVAAVKAKQEGIAHAQENKQEGIKISSTFRDATLITISFFGGREYAEDDFKKKWLEMRNWLWNNFDTAEDKQNKPF